jgi:restriction system protein
MPRRRATPIFEEIASEFEHLPLKVGLVTSALVAVGGWVIPLFVTSDGLNIAGSFALIARYLLWALAFMIFISAAFGATRRWFEGRRFESNVSVQDLSWSQFEGYLAEYFRRRGSAVTPRGGSSADGGVDLVLEDASGRRIVQAKHWKRRRVGVGSLRELWGVIGDEHAQGAVYVTSGAFTPDAQAFAKGKRLELIDGDQLASLIREVKGGATAPSFEMSRAGSCPSCERGTLRRKLARRGVKAGSYFLGCDQYPVCRYTRDL